MTEKWRSYEGIPLKEALASFRSEREDETNRSWIESFAASGSFVQFDLASIGSAPRGTRATDMYFTEGADGRVRIAAYVHEADERRALVLGQNAELRFELFLRDKHSPDPDAAHRVASFSMFSRAVLEKAKELEGTATTVQLKPRDAPLRAGLRTEWREEDVTLRVIDSRDDAIAGTVLEVVVGQERDLVWTFVQKGSAFSLAKFEFSIDRAAVAPLECPPALELSVVRQRGGIKAASEAKETWTLASGADAFHPSVHVELALHKPEPLLETSFGVVLRHEGLEVMRFEVSGAALDEQARADPVRKGYSIATVPPLANAPGSSVWTTKGGALVAVELGFHSVEALWLLVPRPREGRGAPKRTNVVFVDMRKL